jgi:hypothetical protein
MILCPVLLSKSRAISFAGSLKFAATATFMLAACPAPDIAKMIAKKTSAAARRLIFKVW